MHCVYFTLSDGRLHPDCFRDQEDDGDFEPTTHLVRVPRSTDVNDIPSTTKIKINIDGMSCQSCVKNIEGNIGAREDVVSVKVVLEEKAGYIEYKSNQTSANELAQAIEDMGFITSLPSLSNHNANDDSLKNTISTCSIHIDGMTCGSCVKSITGKWIGWDSNSVS